MTALLSSSSDSPGFSASSDDDNGDGAFASPSAAAAAGETSLASVPNERERLAAALAHGGTLFAWFFAPLAIYLVKRGESRWVEHHALQSLLWSAAGTLLALLTCGLAIPVFLVWHVYATVKVMQGFEYDYPVVGDFARGLLSRR